MSYYLHAAKFFLANSTEIGGYLEITDDGQFGQYLPASCKPSQPIIEKGDAVIAPGLVDTHIHGLLGHDVMDNDWAGLNTISEGLLRAGVTSWLPTTLTGSFEQLKAVSQTIGSHRGEETGAKIQGIHFEGPYFTAEHRGAQNQADFRDPNSQEFDQWQQAAQGLIRKISLAPERPGAPAFVRHVTQSGVVASLGHSSATFEQARTCVEAGATSFTHTFNAMSQLSQRSPGMVGAAMYFDQVDDELICDGHHVRPEVATILIREKSPNHTVLITDCMQAGLMPDGDYYLGKLPVYVRDGMARLKADDHLAGSILTLKDAVKNVYDWGAATARDALLMGSYVPARSCHLQSVCGQILPGRAADYLVLDANLNLLATYLDGKKRWSIS